MLKMIRCGLSKKMTALCVLLAMVICASVCVTGYIKYRNSTYQTYNGFAYEMAYTALAYVDGNRMTDYLETGKIDEAYGKMAQAIYTLYENTSLSSIYICVPNPEDQTVTTIYDARVEEAENPDDYALGVIDPIGSTNPQDVIQVYVTGERADNYFIRKSSFGYNTSAILPVRNAAGEVTALLLADVPMPFIIQNLNEYLFFTIGITALLVFLFMFAYLAYLRRWVVSPIKLITENAAAFVHNRAAFSEKMHSICTGDEIETLARALCNMEIDLTSYMENLAAVTAEKERIGAELDVANHIQASMLPCIFPAFPERLELDIYATMTPAKEVGGDFYDFFLTDTDHLVMVMADVSGKGVPAALFMVIAKTLLKNCAQTGLSPKEILEKVNDQLCENNDAELFVTVWLGILEISTGKLIAANAGHEYPVIKKAGGDYELLKDKHGFVLAGMEGSRYQEYELAMQPGDRLFLYTDGVPEATNAHEELYGVQRMLEVLSRNKNVPAQELLLHIKADIDAFVGEAPQFDDITMLSVELCNQGKYGMKTRKFPPTLEALSEATAFVEHELASAPIKVMMQINIALDEIFSNIVHHSGATDVIVGCMTRDEVATLYFSDNGSPYDATKQADPDISLDAEERKIGGLGIFMVKKIMDSMTYVFQHGLNTLTLTKNFHDSN